MQEFYWEKQWLFLLQVSIELKESRARNFDLQKIRKFIC
jgi:hypothetical protein